MPRWSAMIGFPEVSLHALSGMASIAVLPVSSAKVCVAAPLFCSGPR
jgi:hypothetical protein